LSEQNVPIKKPVAAQQTNSSYPLLKEIVNNLVNGTNVFVSKVSPGNVIVLNKERGFKVTNIGHEIDFQYFKYGPSITNTNLYMGKITDKDQSKDIKSYASNINKQVPVELYFSDGKNLANPQDIAAIYPYVLCRNTTPDISINVLKQLNPNVVKEILPEINGLVNGAKRGNSDNPELYGAAKYLNTLIPQQQTQQTVAQQKSQPIVK
jgi:hypothetical protein